MNVGRGRARRPDDWPSSHVRARADLSERLDQELDPEESSWLGAHLEACPECRTIEDAYAAQRLELRALRDRMPPPPRDLWARTAAAIESESRFRDGRARSTGRSRRPRYAPAALLATALVVAVAVGALTSSQWLPGGGDAGPTPPAVALASDTSTGTPAGGSPAATPIAAPRTFAYLSRDPAGDFSLTVRNVDAVCPAGTTEPCGSDAVVEKNPVNLDQDAASVFGSSDNSRLIVANQPTASKGGTISVITLKSSPPDVASPAPPTPTAPASAVTGSPSTSADASASVEPSQASPTDSPSPSVAPSQSSAPSPSIAVTPAPDGSIEIAHDVVLVGQSAAYSASGRWFAFTARPADGSGGPDIYLWKVGDAKAIRVTSDQRSVFGSWAGDVMVGSTVVATAKGSGAAARTDLEPASFLLDPGTTTITPLPQTGKAWRPAVDPRGRLAVYWAGTVRTTSVPGFAPDAGRLVLGDWGANSAEASDSAAPTQLTGDQVAIRHETTIAAGRMDDWDARWDSSGTHLAVWIVDSRNPAVGRLSLYAVDSFDGRIDLKKPLLDAHVAAAGYSISDGKLVWAEPAADGSETTGKVQLLAWTDDGVGTLETVTGPVIVIR